MRKSKVHEWRILHPSLICYCHHTFPNIVYHTCTKPLFPSTTLKHSRHSAYLCESVDFPLSARKKWFLWNVTLELLEVAISGCNFDNASRRTLWVKWESHKIWVLCACWFLGQSPKGPSRICSEILIYHCSSVPLCNPTLKKDGSHLHTQTQKEVGDGVPFHTPWLIWKCPIF